jgi:hypothetical protein
MHVVSNCSSESQHILSSAQVFFISQTYTGPTIALVFDIGSNKRSENPSSSKFITRIVQSSKVQLLADDLPFANSTFKRIYRKGYKMELCHEILPTL